MAIRSKTQGWGEIKQCISAYDVKEMINLLHDLYELSGDNKRFFQTRCFGGDTRREDYRKRILKAVYPDPLSKARVQVHEGLRLIRQYYRASGDIEGTVTLLLDAIDAGVQQALDLGMYEEYFQSLSTLVKALITFHKELPPEEAQKVQARFQEIANRGSSIGWGFGDYLFEMSIELEEI